MLRLVVDPVQPDLAVIKRAARIIREGGVAAIPTDTLYGLAVDPFNQRAVARVFAIKGRSTERALPLVAANTAQIETWLGALSPQAQRLAERFWPGPLTLVVPAPSTLASDVVGGGDTVGIRVPAHEVARALAAACGRPVTATSANASGQPATDDPDRVARDLGGQLDMLLDGGRTPGGLASTIVEATGDHPRLIRAGAIAWDEIMACVLHR